MSQGPPPATIDTDKLPAQQYLILEVLAARCRLGEVAWTFPSRFRWHLLALAEQGLIGVKSGVEPRTFLAWLTDAGKAAALSETYKPPSSVGRCGQAAPMILPDAPRPVCALLTGHAGWHRADGGCEWGVAETSQP